MKKVILTIIALLVLSIDTVFAENLDKYSSDGRIQSALNLLNDTNAIEVFDNLKEQKVKIKFYDFSLMGFSYANVHAMKALSGSQKYILINSNYKNSPPEAIACLIVHESFHKLSKPTLEEEILCTTKEAIYWDKLQDETKNYDKNNVLIARLNRLSELHSASCENNDLIRDKIANSPFYQSQLKPN